MCASIQRIGCCNKMLPGRHFKYRGIKKYRSLLEEGKAVQLATYAYARSQTCGGTFPAVGYLILDSAVLYSPSGSPLLGEGPVQVVDGPGMDEVWQTFAEALAKAEEWLEGKGPVPARPLESQENWPEGVELVVDPSDPTAGELCRYCDYSVLCGMKELT